DVRFWSVVRTDAQIQADMSNTLVGTELGLVDYYNFDEGSGTIAHDSTANPADLNNGVLGGGIVANMPAWVTVVAPVQGTSTQTGTTQDFVFTPSDSYTSFVTFKATGGSTTSSATVIIPITNVAPTANLGGATLGEGQSATVTFNGASDPSADD